jgi:hypothetical protein
MDNTNAIQQFTSNALVSRVRGDTSTKSITTTYRGGESKLSKWCKANGRDVNSEEDRKAFQRYTNGENAKLQAIVSQYGSAGLVFEKLSSKVNNATKECDAVTIRMVRPSQPKIKVKSNGLPEGAENLSESELADLMALLNKAKTAKSKTIDIS